MRSQKVQIPNFPYISLSEGNTMWEKFRLADLTQNQRQFITKHFQITVLDPQACNPPILLVTLDVE